MKLYSFPQKWKISCILSFFYFLLYALFIRCCGEHMCGKAESHLGCCPVNPPLCTWININKNKSLHQVRVAELWGESRSTLRRMIQSIQWSTAGAAAGRLLAEGARQTRELLCAG